MVCTICDQASVGYVTNLVTKKYYCNRHWWVMSAKLNKWMNDQYHKQWGNQDWFIELATPKRKTGKQFKLL